MEPITSLGKPISDAFVQFSELIRHMQTHPDSLTEPPPKLYLPSKHSRRHVHMTSNSQAVNLTCHHLEQYITNTSHLLTGLIHHCQKHRPPRLKSCNISRQDQRFLMELKHDSSIIIKPADKNLGITIMDMTWYDAEVRRQLNDASTYTIATLLNFESSRMMIEARTAFWGKTMFFTEAEQTYFKRYQGLIKDKLKQPDSLTSVIPQLYILPKVHKAKLAGRPIVPSHSTITTALSRWLDLKLQAMLKTHPLPTVISDSRTLVRAIESTCFPSDCILVTADVNSLYTQIPTELGLDLVKMFLKEIKASTFDHEIEWYVEILSIVLKNNYFRYREHVFHQLQGTAMGTPVAPTYANIFMYMLERSIVQQYRAHGTLLYYGRYLDDILMMITDKSTVSSIQHELNNLHPRIKLNFEVSKYKAEFLDLVIFKGERFLSSNVFDLRVHQKSLNLYLYLPFTSAHPIHQKKGMIKTEMIRYIRNSSSIKYYIDIKRQFFHRLRVRGYPAFFLRSMYNCVIYANREQYLQLKQKTNTSRPLNMILPFDTFTKQVHPKIKQALLKYSTILMDNNLPKPMISWSTGKSFLELLCTNKSLGPLAKRYSKNTDKRRRVTTNITPITHYMNNRTNLNSNNRTNANPNPNNR